MDYRHNFKYRSIVLGNLDGYWCFHFGVNYYQYY